MDGLQKGIFAIRKHIHANLLESGEPICFSEQLAKSHCKILYGSKPSTRTWQRWKQKALCSHDAELTGGEFSYVSYILLLAIAYNLRGSSHRSKARNFTQAGLYQYAAAFADTPSEWLSTRLDDIRDAVLTPAQCEAEIERRLGISYSPSRLRKAGLYKRTPFYSKDELIEICNRLLGNSHVQTTKVSA